MEQEQEQGGLTAYPVIDLFRLFLRFKPCKKLQLACCGR